VRYLALSPFVVALGFGGAALAQPTALDDPWVRSYSEAGSWFESEATAAEPTVDPEIRDPWAAPAKASNPATPHVAPPAPKRVEVASKPAATQVPAVASGLESGEVGILDPWAPSGASDIPSLQSSQPEPERTRWSEPFVEVIDPWKRKPELPARERMRLAIDPWAR
jgi:hypothetical protein